MSEFYDEDPRDPRDVPPERAPGRSRALVITAVVLVVAFFGLTTFSSFYTERLWFSDVGFASVFSTLLWTRVGLFLVFGALMAAVVVGQHDHRLPAAAAVPPTVAGAERPGPLPPSGHPDPHLAGRRCRAAARCLRRHLGCGGVAQLPPVAQQRPVRSEGRVLQPRHQLLRLRAAVASLRGRRRDGRRHPLAAGRCGRALPLRRHPPADPRRPSQWRRAGSAVGAARRLRARQGRGLLAGPLRPGAPVGLALHRHHLHRRQRGPAGQEHPDGHRPDLCGAVLRQRVAPHLAAAVPGSRAAGRSPRSCWA